MLCVCTRQRTVKIKHAETRPHIQPDITYFSSTGVSVAVETKRRRSLCCVDYTEPAKRRVKKIIFIFISLFHFFI